MNFDKKRRARVQGGWAAAPSSNQCKSGFRPGNPSGSDPTQAEKNFSQQRPGSSNNLSRQALGQAKSDKGKPPMPIGPVWMAKNVDTPSPRAKFVFQDPEEVEIKFTFHF